MKKADVKIAKRYAAALFEVCQPSDCAQMKVALSDFAQLWYSSDSLRESLLNPSLLHSQKVAALKSIAELLRPGDSLLANFLAELLRNKRLDSIEVVASVFSGMVDALQRHVSLEIISAGELSADERDEIRGRIKTACGAEASLNWRVDRALLGGLVIKAGDRMIDGSIRGSLNKLRTDFLA